MQSRWALGVRKAVARLFPTGPTIRSQEAAGIPADTQTKDPFWSDFDRNTGEASRSEDRLTGRREQPLNILVPFDFTTSSCNALDCALRMARNGKAHITLLHAIHINLSPYGPANVAMIKQDMRRAASSKISQVAALATQQEVSADYAIQEGKPFVVINQFIKEQPVDLVILGCHRHRGTGWFGRPKTAERVVREAPCPVLVLQTEELERISL
jgi:universal stress protein A